MCWSFRLRKTVGSPVNIAFVLFYLLLFQIYLFCSLSISHIIAVVTAIFIQMVEELHNPAVKEFTKNFLVLQNTRESNSIFHSFVIINFNVNLHFSFFFSFFFTSIFQMFRNIFRGLQSWSFSSVFCGINF